jgi:site-specific DNA-methyltransferase (adenine-specific)
LVAALKHGRNSLGVELDPAYCQQAASRLRDQNTDLFGKAQVRIETEPRTEVESASVVA